MASIFTNVQRDWNIISCVCSSFNRYYHSSCCCLDNPVVWQPVADALAITKPKECFSTGFLAQVSYACYMPCRKLALFIGKKVREITHTIGVSHLDTHQILPSALVCFHNTAKGDHRQPILDYPSICFILMSLKLPHLTLFLKKHSILESSLCFKSMYCE